MGMDPSSDKFLDEPQKSSPEHSDPVEPQKSPPEHSDPVEPQKSPPEHSDPVEDKPWPDPTRRRPRNFKNSVWSLIQKTADNPLAAGLIAFGAGILVGALIPVADEASPQRSRLGGAAKQVAGDLDTGKSVLSEDPSVSAASTRQAREAVDSVATFGQETRTWSGG
jgi:hypothetical protein